MTTDGLGIYHQKLTREPAKTAQQHSAALKQRAQQHAQANRQNIDTNRAHPSAQHPAATHGRS